VQLPPGVRDLRVYVNGDEVQEGADYRREGDRLVFSRALVPVRSTGFLRWLTMFTAGIGFYGQGDSVDVHYVDAGGGPGVGSNLRILPPIA
jgi:hypothetical protein